VPKRKKAKCGICDLRKGNRDCLSKNLLICSRCCGEIRNIGDCSRKCSYIIPILKEQKLLPEIRRAYRSPEPGSVILWFTNRDSSGMWNYFLSLVDLWKAGFKDCQGRFSISETEYLLEFSRYNLQFDMVEIPWKKALYFLKMGINIRNALEIPYPDEFYQFKHLVPSLDDIQVTGSIYKCYKCESGNLPEDVVESILDVTLKDITSGTIGQEGENVLYFTCEKCKDDNLIMTSDLNSSNSEEYLIETNKHVQHSISEVVENQIRDNNPSGTKKTLIRLISNGYTYEEAIDLIGGVLLTEMHNMLNVGKPFDEKRYTEALKGLK